MQKPLLGPSPAALAQAVATAPWSLGHVTFSLDLASALWHLNPHAAEEAVVRTIIQNRFPTAILDKLIAHESGPSWIQVQTMLELRRLHMDGRPEHLVRGDVTSTFHAHPDPEVAAGSFLACAGQIRAVEMWCVDGMPVPLLGDSGPCPSAVSFRRAAAELLNPPAGTV